RRRDWRVGWHESTGRRHCGRWSCNAEIAMKKIAFVVVALACVSVVVAGQTGTKNGEWPTYGGDLGNTKYAPLDQITAANFNSLEVAWRFKTDNLGPRPEFQFESTPLMVKGVL